MTIQDSSHEVIQALNAILAPDETGAVRFGAGSEPFRTSQTEVLQAIKEHLEKSETKGHVVMPGGTGKTRVGIALAYAMHKHGRKSLFVVPTQQALEDFVRKAKDLCPDLDVGAVYQDEKRIGNLTFITYKSLLARTLGPEAAADAIGLDDTSPINGNKPSLGGKQLKINPKDFDLRVLTKDR
jgi:superfamily II DNA or RNA helicase